MSRHVGICLVLAAHGQSRRAFSVIDAQNLLKSIFEGAFEAQMIY